MTADQSSRHSQIHEAAKALEIAIQSNGRDYSICVALIWWVVGMVG